MTSVSLADMSSDEGGRRTLTSCGGFGFLFLRPPSGSLSYRPDRNEAIDRGRSLAWLILDDEAADWDDGTLGWGCGLLGDEDDGADSDGAPDWVR